IMAVVRLELPGKPGPDIVTERPTDRGVDRHPIVRAVEDTGLAGKICGGRCRNELDEAPRRVATEQSPLRAAQHLDALYVEHLSGETVFVAEIDIVDVDGDRALVHARCRAVPADAADAEVRRRIGAALERDIEVR